MNQKCINLLSKFKVLPICALVFSLSSCANGRNHANNVYCFDTVVNYQYACNTDLNNEIDEKLNYYSDLFDAYNEADFNNLYTLNHSNEVKDYDYSLIQIILESIAYQNNENMYGLFNAFVKDLADLWKLSMETGAILDQNLVKTYVQQMNTTHLTYNGTGIAIDGEAHIDLGAIAKGYTLDIIKKYLNENSVTNYIFNAGSSSIILGENNENQGYFKVGVKNIDDIYLKLKNCAIGTSSIYEQNKVIDNKLITHIINPLTGNPSPLHDLVLVVGESAKLCDVLSTVCMNCSLDLLKEIETNFNVSVLAYDDNTQVYCSEALEVFNA